LADRRRGLRILLWVGGVLGGLLLLVIVCLGLIGFALHEPLPQGTPGPQAEQLAESLRDSVDHQAWERTGAISWTFAGFRHHLWDRDRHLDRLVEGDLTVWIDLSTRQGRAERDGVALQGTELDAALSSAWAAWANDSFWLNPVVKVFDQGTTRGLVELPDGGQGLLVEYSSGGVTPGDAYLWIPGPDGRPQAWKMWVSVMPIGGMEVSWEGWQQLSTGAWVATTHDSPLGLSMQVTDIEAAESLGELVEGGDPFAEIVP